MEQMSITWATHMIRSFKKPKPPSWSSNASCYSLHRFFQSFVLLCIDFSLSINSKAILHNWYFGNSKNIQMLLKVHIHFSAWRLKQADVPQDDPKPFWKNLFVVLNFRTSLYTFLPNYAIAEFLTEIMQIFIRLWLNRISVWKFFNSY